MPEYYERQVAREQVIRAQERVDCAELVKKSASDAELLLQVLGLTEQ